MASIKLCNFVLLLLLVQLLAPAYVVVQGSRTQVGIPRHQSFSPSSPVHFKHQLALIMSVEVANTSVELNKFQLKETTLSTVLTIINLLNRKVMELVSSYNPTLVFV
ncbi:hypothetical protein CUMW_129290 [Citrus unshiu]|nr:hypothetical protein CUMW_129290 [Citrus unshiu]